jgi:UDP-N-acetylglucosamine 2-epimerase
VTVHPATLDPDPGAVATVVVGAMDRVPATYVITLPNADPGADSVRQALLAAASRPDRVAVEALGERRYWGLMRIADAMLGNSSSAIVEAPARSLPAVDVGTRQAGRRREANVIDAPMDPELAASALRRALDPAFRVAIAEGHPSLLDGGAGRRIAAIIAEWRPASPPRKPPVRLNP